MANFFIDRPVFAWVLVILTMLAGVLAIRTLPVAQYPSIAPPSVAITVNYPGASAETVQSTVVQVIEQQLSGVDGLLYFSSQSNKDGSMQITLYFAQGTNPDIAQVQVQNKLQLAQPRLPQIVQSQGITVAKATRNFLLVVGFVDTSGRMTSDDITDFVASTIQDPLSRTAGVGDYQLFGAQYAMRVWLDPARLYNYGLTPADVSRAISAQNVQVTSGELGGLPSVDGQELNATIVGPSYLQSPDQFGSILLKVQKDGSQVRLRDVAQVELGPQQYGTRALFNGKPAAAMGVKLASGANALDTVKAVHATIERLKPRFPPGVEAVYPYDTTPFIAISLKNVVTTLIEAVALVFIVIYLFLQNLRATLIPTLVVPIVLLGTFAVLAAAGHSINTLTMFGMVLAIGLLVDDAIVVVENVERVMTEEHLPPKEATRRSMAQISGALIGIALVLSAVLLPMAFFGGSTGVIYRQFSITIVSAMVLSVLTALIFTPALCATLLRPHRPDRRPLFVFRWFNRGFNASNAAYTRSLGPLTAHPWRPLVAFAVIVAITGFLFTRLPTGFLPDEDQGVMFLQVTTPPGAAAERTQAVLDQATQYFLTDEKDNVASILTVRGFSFAGRGQNAGFAFVSLKPWDQRQNPADSVFAIAGRAMGRFASIKDALVYAFPPPAVLELGNATGFDLELQDWGGVGHAALMDARNKFLGLAAKSPLLARVRPNGLDDEPQYILDIDWEKASALGLTVADINNALSAAWGSAYVNDFLDRGRIKRVYVQGESDSRMMPEDLGRWYVKNGNGQMVSFAAFAGGHWTLGPPRLERYNGVSSVEILGNPAPGQSTGTAMREVERLIAELPEGVGYAWTALSYEEQQSGAEVYLLYGISILIVFLSLAALYESWAIPAAVIMVVPLGVIGAISITLLRGFNNDVYFQVGLLVTIGLAAKNAILIVEFAKANFERGQTLADAAINAGRERLRPILMTSLAFMLGVLPLALSTGAGAGGQNAIGTGVIGGMITATVLAIFFVPVFFVSVLRLFHIRRNRDEEAVGTPQPAE